MAATNEPIAAPLKVTLVLGKAMYKKINMPHINEKANIFNKIAVTGLMISTLEATVSKPVFNHTVKPPDRIIKIGPINIIDK